MKTSKNYTLNKNKFLSIRRGKQENNLFFVLPSIAISSKRFISWDSMMFSIFCSWGRYYIQFNIYEIVRNTSLEIYKENVAHLMQCLSSQGLRIQDIPATIEYLNKYPFLIQILKNSNLNHLYVKQVIYAYFQNTSFVKPLDSN